MYPPSSDNKSSYRQRRHIVARYADNPNTADEPVRGLLPIPPPSPLLGSVATRTPCTCQMTAHHPLNKIFAGALAVAPLAAALVAALTASPVANADLDFECKPGCWGALAASPSNGQLEIVTNATTQHGAEDKAVLWCDVLGKTNDCDVVTSGLGCLSLAESGDGKAIAGRVAPTQDAADAAALDGAGPASKIDLQGCSSWL